MPKKPLKSYDERKAEIIQGIAAYDREQRIFIRLLRRFKCITEHDFDGLFDLKTPFGKPMRFFLGITGDTFILGGMHLGDWAGWLELVQYMMFIGTVDTTTIDGTIVYHLPGAA